MPLAEDFAFGAKLRQFSHERGVAILSGSGTADGRAGDHILLAPPLTITQVSIGRLKAANSVYVTAVTQIS